MNFLTCVYTDVGIKKQTNQDSALIKVANTEYGKVAFCVICDGMGGLAKGELASATLIYEFNNWFVNKFPEILYNGLNDDRIKNQWEEIIYFTNKKIMAYGQKSGVNLGTTVAAILIAKNKLFVMNVGDTRVYEVSDNIYKITKDQTVVAKEVEEGILSEEEAKRDSRRSVLLQCVGASAFVTPDYYSFEAKQNCVYMLCSDGFRHEISEQEIFEKLNAIALHDETTMNINSNYLVELNKQLGETDNITVALIKTY